MAENPITTMPEEVKHRKRYRFKKKEVIRLSCEWKLCTQSFEEWESFQLHITNHLEEVVDSVEQNLECCWQDCNYVMNDGFCELLRHTYFHAFHTKIKCFGLNFIERNNLQHCRMDNNSRNTIPHLPDRFQCAFGDCDEVFDDPDPFYNHVIKHTSHLPKARQGSRHQCGWQGCHQVLNSKYKLQDHLRSHTQEKQLACPQCGSLFSNSIKFIDHFMRQAYQSSETFQCSYCYKGFTSEKLLKDHMRKHVNKNKCPYCDMTTPAPSALRKHIAHRHTKSDKYACETCRKEYKSLRSLKRHFDHCSELGQQLTYYMCSQTGCTFKTTYESRMSLHMKNKHGGLKELRYLCHICALDYACGKNLTKHLQSKHDYTWAPGHPRFKYNLGADGYYRLQTSRYESFDLARDRLDTEESGPLEEGSDFTSGTSTLTNITNTPTHHANVVDSYNDNCESQCVMTDSNYMEECEVELQDENKEVYEMDFQEFTGGVSEEIQAVEDYSNMEQVTVYTEDGEAIVVHVSLAQQQEVIVEQSNGVEEIYNLQMLGEVAAAAADDTQQWQS